LNESGNKNRNYWHNSCYTLNLTRTILLDVNPAGWGQRQATNPEESACASPARLFLDVNTMTDKRIRRFRPQPAGTSFSVERYSCFKTTVLGLSVEYLATGKEYHQSIDISNYLQFRNVLDDLSVLPDEILAPIQAMIKTAANNERQKNQRAVSAG
jgi:hypothetical protein